MDPRTLHFLVDDMMRFSHVAPQPEQTAGFKVNPKRYGAYFPSQASLDEKWHLSDNESTWEFREPMTPTSRSSSSSTCMTTCSSPAQEIALRYRAGMPLDFVRTRSSFADEADDDASFYSAPLDDASISEYDPVIPEKEVKAIFRQSRCDALLDTVCIQSPTLYPVVFIDRSLYSTRKLRLP